MSKKKVDPYQRGVNDYRQGIITCPYPPKSKAAQQWKAAQEYESFNSLSKARYLDDGGCCNHT